MSHIRARLVLQMIDDFELQALADEVDAEIHRRQHGDELRKSAAEAWAEENAEALAERRAHLEAHGMPLEHYQSFKMGFLESRATPTPEDDPLVDIEAALGAIQSSYWKLCDQAGEALNPRDIGLPGGVVDILEGDFELAVKAEVIAKRNGISLSGARQYV